MWALIAYWFSDAFNAATWEFASSILAIGLSYRDAVGIVATAFLIISVVISLNGATGVLYHAPFPVLARAGYVDIFLQIYVRLDDFGSLTLCLSFP